MCFSEVYATGKEADYRHNLRSVKKALFEGHVRLRPSISVGFPLNSVQNFFTKSSRASGSVIKTGLVTATLH